MKDLVFAVMAAISAVAVAEPSVSRVLVRQQWPWERTVRVEYELQGADSPMDVDISVETESGTVYGRDQVLAARTDGEIFGVENGFHSFAFDPRTLFGSALTKARFTVRMEPLGASDPHVNRIEYRIFDLETGAVTDLRRRDFYNAPAQYGSFTTNYSSVGTGFVSSLGEGETFIWTGVKTNTVCKSRKLVMKRIHAAGKTFYMGPHPDDTLVAVGAANLVETRFQVSFTNDFYIGVFELTKGQNELVTGYDPGFFTNVTDHAFRAFEASDENLANDDRLARTMSGENGFCRMASALCGKTIRFPTEAEWEFAAKAGYDGPGYPNGKEVTSANFAELEDYSSGSGSTDRNSSYFTFIVGRGRPNPNGLYNMFGFERECTSDLAQSNLLNYYENSRGLTQPFVNPRTLSQNVGAVAYVFKGAEFNQLQLSHSRPSFRAGYVPWQARNGANCPGVFGCRVMCEAD